MKYKVGDRVKNTIYGEGTIIGIDKTNEGKYYYSYLVEFDKENKRLHNGNIENCNIVTTEGKNKGKKGHCYWCGFDSIVEEAKIELVKEDTDIVEYKGNKYDVVEEFAYESPAYCCNVIELKLKEHKEEILDKEEKEYLSAVIKPFRSRINYIKKKSNNDKYYIVIAYDDYDFIPFPDFKRDTMYKNMEANRHYKLEDLGL